jgi:peptidoglycan/LPS O-acetylase OafA/YrhL
MNSKVNNFDLIRLFAAFEVVIGHSVHHLEAKETIIAKFDGVFLDQFPGVPIFFFISGFLIYGSLARNSDNLKRYARNRLLRIYPALWVALIITVVLLLAAFPQSQSVLLSSSDFWAWLVGQISFFHFYTPDILRFWGVGTPNGSLWTIGVELQFYLLLPLVVIIGNRLRLTVKLTVLLFVASIMISYTLVVFSDEETLLYKLTTVTILPYFYFFAIGALMKMFWSKINTLLEGKLIWWMLGYLIFQALTKGTFDLQTTTYLVHSPFNIISSLILAGVVFSAAYTKRELSGRLLRGNDISYGVYVYHMLLINWLVQHNYVGEMKYIFLVLAVTALLGWMSWRFVEQPAMRLK